MLREICKEIKCPNSEDDSANLFEDSNDMNCSFDCDTLDEHGQKLTKCCYFCNLVRDNFCNIADQENDLTIIMKQKIIKDRLRSNGIEC